MALAAQSNDLSVEDILAMSRLALDASYSVYSADNMDVDVAAELADAFRDLKLTWVPDTDANDTISNYQEVFDTSSALDDVSMDDAKDGTSVDDATDEQLTTDDEDTDTDQAAHGVAMAPAVSPAGAHTAALDAARKKASDRFVHLTCNCPTPCASKLNKEATVTLIAYLDQMNKSQRRQVLQHGIALIGKLPALPAEGDPPPAKKARMQANYMLCGQEVCKPIFLAVFRLGAKAVKATFRDLREGRLEVVYQARGRRSATSAGKFAQLFIQNQADKYGLPRPDMRGPCGDQRAIILLPPHMFKMAVFKEYQKVAGDMLNVVALRKTAFFDLWKKKLGHIRIMKRHTDFCDTCADLRVKNDVVLLHAHLQQVSVERDFHNRRQDQARQSNEIKLLAFDFAQKIQLPIFHDQPKKMYYDAGLYLDLFGVADCVSGRQYNFALAEGHWPNQKGANTVCAMIHFYLESKGIMHVPYLWLSADNCAGQNKNKFFIWYLAWRALHYGHKEIYLHFKLAGTTNATLAISLMSLV